jgi:predicted dehydrogenase
LSSTQASSVLRLGILGGANIARQFTRDVRPSERVRVVAVASRNDDSAKAFADANGIDTWFGSYDALLASPDIDAVYIPLPNSLHAEWAIKAANHGKHVLCEKPLALDLNEAVRMFEAADRNDVMLLESFPYYFQPQTAAMMSLIGEGAIGDVRAIQASFGFTVGNPGANIRMKPELGGGALLDAGSYPLSLVRLVMGRAPQRVDAVATWADSNVDISLMATLVYADGRRAQVSCSMDAANHRHATIIGTQGTIDTEYLNHTSAQMSGDEYGYLPSQLRVRRGIPNSVPFETVASEAGSGFFFAAESFARMIASHDAAAIEYYAQVSLDNAATLAAIIESARSERPVSL